ncbi:MAG: hypothetical protein KC589_00615 [Nanoarchaeota archaeon]|nr:hypothetical protein [Nanoarchaeota archaeon]MCA9495419.1 hypothetical protein [Nanoarchaeota archaeon]
MNKDYLKYKVGEVSYINKFLWFFAFLVLLFIIYLIRADNEIISENLNLKLVRNHSWVGSSGTNAEGALYFNYYYVDDNERILETYCSKKFGQEDKFKDCKIIDGYWNITYRISKNSLGSEKYRILKVRPVID